MLSPWLPCAPPHAPKTLPCQPMCAAQQQILAQTLAPRATLDSPHAHANTPERASSLQPATRHAYHHNRRTRPAMHGPTADTPGTHMGHRGLPWSSVC